MFYIGEMSVIPSLFVYLLMIYFNTLPIYKQEDADRRNRFRNIIYKKFIDNLKYPGPVPARDIEITI